MSTALISLPARRLFKLTLQDKMPIEQMGASVELDLKRVHAIAKDPVGSGSLTSNDPVDTLYRDVAFYLINRDGSRVIRLNDDMAPLSKGDLLEYVSAILKNEEPLFEVSVVNKAKLHDRRVSFKAELPSHDIAYASDSSIHWVQIFTRNEIRNNSDRSLLNEKAADSFLDWHAAAESHSEIVLTEDVFIDRYLNLLNSNAYQANSFAEEKAEFFTSKEFNLKLLRRMNFDLFFRSGLLELFNIEFRDPDIMNLVLSDDFATDHNLDKYRFEFFKKLALIAQDKEIESPGALEQYSDYFNSDAFTKVFIEQQDRSNLKEINAVLKTVYGVLDERIKSIPWLMHMICGNHDGFDYNSLRLNLEDVLPECVLDDMECLQAIADKKGVFVIKSLCEKFDRLPGVKSIHEIIGNINAKNMSARMYEFLKFVLPEIFETRKLNARKFEIIKPEVIRDISNENPHGAFSVLQLVCDHSGVWGLDTNIRAAIRRAKISTLDVETRMRITEAALSAGATASSRWELQVLDQLLISLMFDKCSPDIEDAKTLLSVNLGLHIDGAYKEFKDYWTEAQYNELVKKYSGPEVLFASITRFTQVNLSSKLANLDKESILNLLDRIKDSYIIRQKGLDVCLFYQSLPKNLKMDVDIVSCLYRQVSGNHDARSTFVRFLPGGIFYSKKFALLLLEHKHDQALSKIPVELFFDREFALDYLSLVDQKHSSIAMAPEFIKKFFLTHNPDGQHSYRRVMESFINCDRINKITDSELISTKPRATKTL